jgi:hypothetical protein
MDRRVFPRADRCGARYIQVTAARVPRRQNRSDAEKRATLGSRLRRHRNCDASPSAML